MRILVVHNSYVYPGGEDVVVAQECELLRNFGHHVVEYRRSNDEIRRLSKLKLARELLWSARASMEIRELVERERIDVAHFHNTTPLISPAPYYVCVKRRVPVIQTLHNYRLACPRADFFRAGRVCEQCLGHSFAWRGVIHACYRDSRTESGAVAFMLLAHRWMETWQRAVSVYIALTEFQRRKLVAAGLPPEKIVVKPNFIDRDPGLASGTGHYAIFVGRFLRESIIPLLDAWKRIADLPLKLVGRISAQWLEEEIHKRDLETRVAIVDHLPRDQVFALLKDALCLLFPSPWYETFGMAMIEAFACGVPVIASRLGAMAEIVEDRRTGLHYIPGDAADLADKINWAAAHRDELRTMGRAARESYLRRYTGAQNYPLLMAIYEKGRNSVSEQFR